MKEKISSFIPFDVKKITARIGSRVLEVTPRGIERFNILL